MPANPPLYGVEISNIIIIGIFLGMDYTFQQPFDIFGFFFIIVLLILFITNMFLLFLSYFFLQRGTFSQYLLQMGTFWYFWRHIFSVYTNQYFWFIKMVTVFLFMYITRSQIMTTTHNQSKNQLLKSFQHKFPISLLLFQLISMS